MIRNGKDSVVQKTGENGHAEMSWLLRAVNARNKKDVSPLANAIKKKKKQAIKVLLDLGAELGESELFMSYADPETKLLVGETEKRRKQPLFENQSDSEYVSSLKTGPIQTPLSGGNKAPPAVWAAYNGKAEVLSAILKHDPNAINSIDKNSIQPLVAGAKNGHYGVTKVMVEAKADLEGKQGLSAMKAAIEGKHTAVALILLGSLPENFKCELSTLVPLTVVNNSLTVLRELLELDVDANTKDLNGKTPLHTALSVELPKAAIIGILLDNGAKIDAEALSMVDLD